MASGSEPVDVRPTGPCRARSPSITLGAFVFRQRRGSSRCWPCSSGAGALLGPAGNPFHRIFGALVAPRLSPAGPSVPAATIRAQDVLAAALLGAATLCILIGLGGVAWIVTLAEAGVAAVAATTGVHLGVVVRDRIRRAMSAGRAGAAHRPPR